MKLKELLEAKLKPGAKELPQGYESLTKNK